MSRVYFQKCVVTNVSKKHLQWDLRIVETEDDFKAILFVFNVVKKKTVLPAV